MTKDNHRGDAPLFESVSKTSVLSIDVDRRTTYRSMDCAALPIGVRPDLVLPILNKAAFRTCAIDERTILSKRASCYPWSAFFCDATSLVSSVSIMSGEVLRLALWGY